MTVLSNNDRVAECAEMQRGPDCPGGVTKAQLLAVYAALDDWWETVAATANLAIPQPQRTALTTKQKAHIFMRVLRRRYEVN